MSDDGRRTIPQRLGLTLSEWDDGESWLGELLRRVGLARLSQALGLGVHSDRLLLRWAAEREQSYREAWDRSQTAAISYGSHRWICPRHRRFGNESAGRCACGWLNVLDGLTRVPEGYDPDAWTTAIGRARSRS